MYVYPFPQLTELLVPCFQGLAATARLERRIALLQRATELPPQAQVIRFHVERQPVEKAPPLIRAAADQVMHIGINYLQRQRRGERCRTAAAVAIYPHF